MFSHNGKISARQMTLLLILQMLNLNMLMMPRIGARYLNRNAYLAPICAIVIGILEVWIITALTNHFEHKTLVEITKELLPNWLAVCLMFLFVIKLVMSTSLELRMFGELISQIMLPKTPISMIMICMLLVSAYLVKNGVEATGRMGEIMLYFVGVPLFIALLLVAFRTDYEELLPFFRIDFGDAFIGVGLVSVMFVPIEAMLMLTGLMRYPEKSRKAGFIAVITIGIVQALISLFCITQNGVYETQNQMWPTILLMKSLGMKNTIVENQEVLMLIVWIFTVYMYICINLYISSLIGSRCFEFKRENVFVLPLIPVVLLLANLPYDLGVIYKCYLNFEYYFGLWFVIPIPLILLGIAKMKGVRSS